MLAAYATVRTIWLTHEAEFLAQLNDPKKAKEVQFMMQKLEQLYLERSKKTNPNTTNEAFEKCYQRFKKELYPRFQTAIKSKTKLELSDAEQTLLEELHQTALGFGKNPVEKYASVVAQILTEFPKWVAQIAGIPDSNNPELTFLFGKMLKKKNVSFKDAFRLTPSVYNISGRSCFYKPESDSTAIEIPSNDFSMASVDGIATCQFSNRVYKICDLPNLAGVVISPGGFIFFTSVIDHSVHTIGGKAIEFVNWITGKNIGTSRWLDTPPDSGWDALFAAALTI